MEQYNVYETPVVTEAAQPKFCIARAIVSMGVGIEGLVLAVMAGVYGFVGLLGSFTAVFEVEAGLVFSGILLLYTILFGVIAIVSGAVAIAQANKFNALYHRESKMAKAGKVMGVISLVLSILAIVGGIVVVVLLAMAL